jgi:peptidyl-prolyl cis-trans isomerase D
LKFGTIANAIEPSTDTYRDVFAQANKFQGENRDVEAFTKAVETEGLTKRTAEGIKIGDRTLPGFTNAREVVRWMHKAELNDVSNTFELEDKYVVAVLTKITPKGYKPFEDVKAEIETAVRRDKKAEKLLVQAKDAAAKNKDIMAAATSLNNIFQVFQGASFANNFMPSMGRELNVLGKITKAKIGEMLPPIKGERGVYLVVLDSVSTAPGMDNIEAMKMNLGMQISQRAQNEALSALRERVEITDKRYQFY